MQQENCFSEMVRHVLINLSRKEIENAHLLTLFSPVHTIKWKMPRDQESACIYANRRSNLKTALGPNAVCFACVIIYRLSEFNIDSCITHFLQAVMMMMKVVVAQCNLDLYIGCHITKQCIARSFTYTHREPLIPAHLSITHAKPCIAFKWSSLSLFNPFVIFLLSFHCVDMIVWWYKGYLSLILRITFLITFECCDFF